MASVVYCDHWNGLLREPAEVLSTREAERRYAAKARFAVLMVEAEPFTVISFSGDAGYVTTAFHDVWKRKTCSYGFSVQTDGDLFLSEACLWEYPDDPDALSTAGAVRVDSFAFCPDGYAMLMTSDYRSGETALTDSRGAPADAFREPRPRFGHWASLARMDRDLPVW